MNYMTTQDASKIWGISTRRITTLCKDGRVNGAVYLAHAWLIPKDAIKPEKQKVGRKNSINKKAKGNIKVEKEK